MQDSQSKIQKRIYKLVEQIANIQVQNEQDFLVNLLTNIVDNPDFQITGGRIWELQPENDTYRLFAQYGNVKKIPDNYTLKIADQPVLKELWHTKTMLRKETDQLLKDSGIFIYSVTGVGEIIKTPRGKYYQYVFGFNAPEILQTFYETLSIISAVASSRLKDFKLIRSQEKIQRDIHKAADIQRNLFPDHTVKFADFEIFGLCVPDSEVGGDYFDYFENMENEEERLGILVADAASKGLSAAIQSLFVSGAVKMALKFSPKISTLFYNLNNLIYDSFPLERFVTMFYCELSQSSNRLVLYANAGHGEPIHYRSEDKSVRLLGSTGGILGIVPNQKFAVENIRLKAGDILAITTDGITEAQNSKGELFGHERIIDVIQENSHKSANEIALLIMEAVQNFSANSVYNDDKTLIVIKRKIS